MVDTDAFQLLDMVSKKIFDKMKKIESSVNFNESLWCESISEVDQGPGLLWIEIA